MPNALYYGDNLTVLRESIASESVDLIYLDPAFNSNATYNVLFRAPAGQQSEAQLEAFDDTWHWGDSASRAFDDVIHGRTSGMVRDLKGTVERESAAAGLFVTLAEPTREMQREAAASGLFETSFGRHPKIQLITIQQLLAGIPPDLPTLGRGEGFRSTPRERGKSAEQPDLGI